ncbi:Cyclin family protein [Perilla frutescens var. hirtella]|nr:Cyclin family protein [Perilla frutescens var. hirtella]
MASRQVVQQRNAEEAAAPAANNPKRMAAERKNRRALGDIGNIVPVNGVGCAKPIPRISRPVTRSFGAQLLANAKAAQSQTNKNSMEANAAVPEKRAVARRLTQKIASIKPKPEEIIEVSPDSNEVAEKEKIVCEEIELKKKAPTLTSTLTARSKAMFVLQAAACGLSDKRKEKMIDIDAEDVGNDLAVVEYVDEIYKFYKSVENEGRAHDYMDSKPEINERMRAILIDWLIQVHYKFELSLETLYLTINILDRFLASKDNISRRELQLVGMSAMLIASKYEEIWAPQVNDLVCISDRAYTNEQVLVMEKRILGQLEWNLTVPTPYVFLVRFIKASMTGSDVENMVYFLAELGMINYETIVYCPSMIAASAVYAARCTLNKAPLWNETLKMHTGFSEPQLIDCAKMLVAFHSMAGDQKLKGAYRKYSSSERGGVALLPPAKSLLVD